MRHCVLSPECFLMMEWQALHTIICAVKGIDQWKKRWVEIGKLFTLRFSNKSVQGPSSERPKTILSEPCFSNLKSIIVSKYWQSIGLRHTFYIIHLTEMTVFYSDFYMYTGFLLNPWQVTFKTNRVLDCILRCYIFSQIRHLWKNPGQLD